MIPKLPKHNDEIEMHLNNIMKYRKEYLDSKF